MTSVFFSSCDSVVGDALGSIKLIEAPYLFDWENAIALHAMQGNRASSRGEGEVSWVFSSSGSIILEAENTESLSHTFF